MAGNYLTGAARQQDPVRALNFRAPTVADIDYRALVSMPQCEDWAD